MRNSCRHRKFETITTRLLNIAHIHPETKAISSISPTVQTLHWINFYWPDIHYARRSGVAFKYFRNLWTLSGCELTQSTQCRLIQVAQQCSHRKSFAYNLYVAHSGWEYHHLGINLHFDSWAHKVVSYCRNYCHINEWVNKQTSEPRSLSGYNALLALFVPRKPLISAFDEYAFDKPDEPALIAQHGVIHSLMRARWGASGMCGNSYIGSHSQAKKNSVFSVSYWQVIPKSLNTFSPWRSRTNPLFSINRCVRWDSSTAQQCTGKCPLSVSRWYQCTPPIKKSTRSQTHIHGLQRLFAYLFMIVSLLPFDFM